MNTNNAFLSHKEFRLRLPFQWIFSAILFIGLFNGAICFSQSCGSPATVSATGCAGSYILKAQTYNTGVTSFRWYTSSSGGAPFFSSTATSSNTYNASSYSSNFSSSVTYYVSVVCNGTETGRASVSFTLIPEVGISVVASNNNLMQNTPITLTASNGISNNGNTYNWYKGSANGYILASNTSSISVTNGDNYYVTGTDNCGKNSTASIFVNYQPIADAGQSYTIGSQNSTYVIYGAGFDPEGQSLSYNWTKMSGAGITMVGITTSALTVTGFSIGSYTFQLKVTDSYGASSVSQMTLTVGTTTNNSVQREEIIIPSQSNVASLSSLSSNQKNVSYTYADGVGRTAQVVQLQSSPSGKDILQPYEYDDLGRAKKTFLPIATSSTTGNFHANATGTVVNNVISNYTASDHYAFYNGTGQTVAQDAMPYADQVFSSDPLGRVVQKGSPGAAWQPGVANGYSTASYGTNGSSGSALVSYWTASSTGLPSTNSSYASNTLRSVTATDEQGLTTLSFANRQGLKVATKVAVPTNLSSSGYSETYYVYDGFNRLRFILPPEFIKIYQTGNSWSAVSKTDVDAWCYQFIYDSQGRLAKSKRPGAGWEYTVYDARDRVVMTQDSVQRVSNQWSYTKYDALNRPLITGIYNAGSSIDQPTMQTTINALSNGLGYQNIVTAINSGVKTGLEFVIAGYENINEYRAVTSITLKPGFDFAAGSTGTSFRISVDNGSGTDGLAANIYPSQNNIDMVVTYYDSYTNCAICNDANYQFTSESFNAQPPQNNDPYAFLQSTGVAGKVVASNVRNLAASTWLPTVVYYNWHGQAIQTIGGNHFGGRDRFSSLYDFSGKKIEDLQSAIGYNSGNVSTLRKMIAYDAVGRPTLVKHQINSQPSVIMSKLTYNELGEVINKCINSADGGSTFLQSVDYRSNIRGWLTNINDIPSGDDANDYFGMDFTYNGTVPGPTGAGNTPRTDGLVSAIRWKQDLTNKHKLYNFTYDALDRLASANFKSDYNPVTNLQTSWSNQSDFYSESNITYDLNGNIKSLNRNQEFFNANSFVADPIDQLTYDYSAFGGNRLGKVTDASTSTNKSAGFSDGANTGSDYAYDGNGAVIQDLNKKIINISYYFNRLPQQVTFSDNSYMHFTYDAAGIKLNQSYYNSSGQLQSCMDYIGPFVFLKGPTDPSPLLAFITTDQGRIVAPVYANLMNNPDAGSTDGYSALGSVQLSTSYNAAADQSYVTATCNQTGGTAGVFPVNTTSGTSVAVKPGESYSFKVLGYQAVGGSASIYVYANTGDLMWPGPTLPQGPANENWTTAAFTVPSNVTSIQVGVKWNGPTTGNVIYINKIALYKTDFEYQYFIKDQVGSPRAVLQTNVHTDKFVATMEPQNQTAEVKTTSNANGFSNMTAQPSNLFIMPPANHTPGGSYAVKLNAQFKVGPAKSLQVFPGDVINASVWCYYPSGSSYTKTAAGTMATMVANSLVSSLGFSSSVLGDPGSSAAGTNLAYNGTNPLGIAMSPNSGSAAPSAFLNYIQFDKDFNPISGKSVPVPATPNSLGQISIPTISVKELGYVYIYLSYDNDTGGDVYFDDLTISQQESPLIQVSNYYPFGLQAYTWIRPGEVNNAYLFQGKELIAQTGWHDFGSRMYWGDLGRWFATDPQNQFSSPYLAMGNMPTMGRDPNGELFGIDDLIVSAVGFVVGDLSFAFTKGGGFKGIFTAQAAMAGLEGAAIAEVGYLTLGGGLAAGGSIKAATSFASIYASTTIANVAGNKSQLSQMDAVGAQEAIMGFEGLSAVQAGFQSDWAEGKVDDFFFKGGSKTAGPIFKGATSDALGGFISGGFKGEIGNGFSLQNFDYGEGLAQGSGSAASKIIGNIFDNYNDNIVRDSKQNRLIKTGNGFNRPAKDAIFHQSSWQSFIFKETIGVALGQLAVDQVRRLRHASNFDEPILSWPNFFSLSGGGTKDGINLAFFDHYGD